MATTPATAPAHVQTEQVITLSSTSVAGNATVGFGSELNPSHVQRTLDAQRQAQRLRQSEQQRVFTERKAVEQPKPTKGRLLYAAMPDGTIMLYAHAMDFDRA